MSGPAAFPEQPDFASAAEQTVWEHLARQLPAEAVLIAGQRVTAGGKEVEADLLVLWPGIGIAVIEVEGGRISLEDGAWRQADRTGSRVLPRSPIDQAQRAKHHLLDYLGATSSRPAGRAVHLADRIVHARNSQTRDAYAPLYAAQCEHAVGMLRRSHRAIENHQLLAKEIADEGNRLTREQERAIAMPRFQHRAQIIGGAGSGKTHLAMIKARTLARDGFRTALLCYSRGLARHFQLLSATWPEQERPAYVGLFHDLPVRWGAETEDDFDGPAALYYEEHLPGRLAELARGQVEDELFDAIVVDEAQDFADAWWEALQPCLRDPAEGVLFVFADEHQSVFDREGRAPITLNPFPLDDNLRSTRTIAHAFAPLTPVEQTPRLPAGAPVRYLPSSAEDAVATADDAVEQLMDEGWELGQIALLTTGSRHPVQKEQVDLEGYDGYWDGFFSATDVFYGHVLGFQGLERPVVVLAVNGFGSAERARQLLYVGLSRARSLLVVVGDGGEIWDAGGPEVWERISGSS